MLEIPKSANLECHHTSLFPNNSIQTFGFEFVAKGNVTFSWEAASSQDALSNYLCSPWYFMIKEFVRRTQLNAIPVIADSKTWLDASGPDEILELYLSLVMENKLDLYMHVISLSEMLTKYLKTSNRIFIIDPIVNILGAEYSSLEEYPFFSILQIFDYYVWFSMFIEVLIVPIIISIDLLRLRSGSNFLLTYAREFWHNFEIVCLNNFKIKKWTKTLRIMYGLFILASMVLMEAFSSSMLSLTVHEPYVTIDSIEDLLNRNDLQPIIILTHEEIDEIQKSRETSLISIVKRSRDNDLLYSELAENKIQLAFSAPKFQKKLSENVIISKKLNIDLLKGNGRDFHIASNKYLYKPQSILYNKNLSRSIIDPFDKMYENYSQLVNYSINSFSDMTETGVFFKFIETAINYGFNFGLDKSDALEDKNKFLITLLESRIAFGPFIIGIFLAVMIAIFEILSPIDWRFFMFKITFLWRRFKRSLNTVKYI